MMRKHDLIPPDSPYRKSFLEGIALHREIQDAYQSAAMDCPNDARLI
jgi:hypothetical protein